MKPFQVNCSELIADFKIHNDEEVRKILIFLVQEYDIEVYYKIHVSGQKEFFFNENRSFNIDLDNIPINVNVSTNQYYEYWIVRSADKNNIGRIIESIGKYQIQKYGESEVVASSLLARNLINKIITLVPNYNLQAKDLLGEINFDEVFEINLEIGNDKHATTLCYGSNGYDDTLGWYFNGEHYEQNNYPFFEWAEKSYNAKIRPFDGGNIFGYQEYKENPDREKLREKI